jgi:hypothetical protein
MTEEEAKQRWCPFARLLAHTYSQDGQGRSYEGGYSYNRSPDSDDDRGPHMPGGSLCIASACMAWRWKLPADERRYPNSAWAEERRDHGFCGLAGAVR